MEKCFLKIDSNRISQVKEGFECKSDKKFSNYLDIAKGSCGEVRDVVMVMGIMRRTDFGC